LLQFLIHFVAHTLSCGVNFNIGPGILDASAIWKTQTHHFSARSSVEFSLMQLIMCSWFLLVDMHRIFLSSVTSENSVLMNEVELCWNLAPRGRVWALKLCKKWSSIAQHCILRRNSPYSLN